MSLTFNTIGHREEALPQGRDSFDALDYREWVISGPLRWCVIGLIAILFMLGLSFAAQRYGVEPYVPLLALIAIATTMVATRRFTGALVAGLLYVGNFKTTAAIGFSVTDPTFIVLVLCSAGLLIESLFIFSRPGGSLLALFEGQGRAVLLFLLLLTVMGLSELYTVAPENGLLKLERFAVFCSISFFAPFILLKKPKDLEQFLITAVILSLALSLRNMVDLFHPTYGVLSGNEDITRIGDGELIGTTLIILVYHRFSGKWPRLRLACIALLSIGLIASAARSAAFSVLIVLALTSYLIRARRNRARSGRVLLAVMLAGIIVAGAVVYIRQLPGAQAKVGHKIDELQTLIQGSFLEGGTAEQRMNFYRQSLVAITERPVFGWGVSGWGVFFLGGDERAIPHNFVLEAAVEEGLIGCAILLAFLWTAGSTLRRTVLRAGPYFTFLLPVFLLSILVNLVTGDLGSRLLWFWCGTIFAAARLIRQLARQRAYVAGYRY